jgi:hypothetical protein
MSRLAQLTSREMIRFLKSQVSLRTVSQEAISAYGMQSGACP